MKKIGFTVLFLAFLITSSFFFYGQENDTAKNIASSCELNLTLGDGPVSRLLDGNVATSCTAKERFELKIQSDTPIYGIYFIWNHTPPQWTLSGEETVCGGDYGFWHEYKPLNGGLSYTLTWDGTGTLADIYLFDKGNLPDYVQVWEPPCEKADFLLLPTHADDEHLWFGGTMPYYGGDLGYKIQVVYLMKHVYGRHHELINGLWTGGVRNYPIISEFTDRYCDDIYEAKAYYPEEEVAEFLVENIRRFKPEVIVGHDLEGEYGHGAHILNATVLSQRALTEANDPEKFTESYLKYGTWETKKCYLHLYQENEIFINWKEKSLTAFDGKNAYEVAQLGFEEHKSQVAYFSMSLDNRKRYGNGLFGLYSSTVGEDVLKNDFLENIPVECLTTWKEPEPIITDTGTNTDITVTDTDILATNTSDRAGQSDPPLFDIVLITILVAACIVILFAIFLFLGKRRKK